MVENLKAKSLSDGSRSHILNISLLEWSLLQCFILRICLFNINLQKEAKDERKKKSSKQD
jgi:hypothetical protein